MRFYTELTRITLYSYPKVSTFTNPEQQVYLEKKNATCLSRKGRCEELGNDEGLDVKTRKQQGLGSFCGTVVCWRNDGEGKRFDTWNVYRKQRMLAGG